MSDPETNEASNPAKHGASCGSYPAVPSQAAGFRTSPPRCSALIRRCDGCQTVTAIDLDNTLKHKREMQLLGQTVYEVTGEEARTHFKSAGPCRCRQNPSHHDGAAPAPSVDGVVQCQNEKGE